MLRSAVIEEPVARSFDHRLIRKVKVQTVKDSFAYWVPTLIGSVLAFLILFTSLDLLSVHHSTPSVQLPAGTAIRDRNQFPSFELNKIPRFDR